MATVLVALAKRESRPSQIKAGKETRVPPPAMELMTPAMNAATNATAPCQRWNASVNFEDNPAGHVPKRTPRKNFGGYAGDRTFFALMLHALLLLSVAAATAAVPTVEVRGSEI